MRLTRRNAALLVLVVLLALLNALFVRGPGRAVEPERLFPGLDPARAVRVELSAPDGGRVTLERADASAPWTIAERFGWPAYAPALESFLRALQGASDVEREASSADAHVLLGVDPEHAVRVRVQDARGTALAEGLQGRAPEGARGSRLVVAGRADVYRTASVPAVAPEPRRWLAPDVLSFQPPAARVLELADGSRRARLERLANGRWSAAGAELAPATIEPFLQALSSLVVADVSGRAQAQAADALPVGFSARIELAAPSGASPAADWLALALDPAATDGVAAGAGEALVRRDAPGGSFWIALPGASAERVRALGVRLLDALAAR